jgi:hypothetical protein
LLAGGSHLREQLEQLSGIRDQHAAPRVGVLGLRIGRLI